MDAVTVLDQIAALIDCLPPSDAERLLDRLPPNKAAAVRRRCGELPTQDQPSIATIRQFIGELSGRPATLLLHRIDGPSGFSSFHFLQRQQPSRLAAVLSAELPQTIAAALTLIPANQAAEVLAHLPKELQRCVAVAMRESGPVSEDVRLDLAELLQARMSAPERAAALSQDGRQQFEAILACTDEPTRRWLAG